MIRFENVHKRYDGGREALAGVTFSIERGELAFLTGPSGAGKSTVLRLIALIDRPTRGTVLVNDQNTARISRRRIPRFRQRLGVVFQDHKLLYDRNVFQNVLLPLQIAGFDGRDAARRARAALDKVGLLGKEKAMPITLSGGEQQRVCIARAVAHRPAVLLADEPTGNLDDAYARNIVELFRAFHQVGVTVVIATHDHGVGEQLSARTINLTHGRVAA